MASRNPRWPKCVYLENGRIVYKKWNSELKKFNTPVRLGAQGMTVAQVWSAYLAIFPDKAPDNSLNWLIDKYFKSDQYRKLAKGTQDNYRKLAKITDHPVNNGETSVGQLEVTDFTTPMLRRLRDIRAKNCSNSWANRQIAFLSVVFSWGLQYIDNLIDVNPCKGIRRLPEAQRKVYVTPEMYKGMYNLAYPREQVIMEIAYLIACRGQEVLNLKRTDILDEGLLVERLKGSSTNIVEWSERLRKAVDGALELHKDSKAISPYLIPGRLENGQLPKSTFDSAWQRLKGRAKKAGVVTFNPHDLKKAGYTDGEDENLTGHTTEEMKNLYYLKPRIVKPAK